MNQTHTPTPWAWCNNNTCLYHETSPNTQNCILHCDPINAPDEANANHIVHCVNVHDELVEVLKEWQSFCKNDELSTWPYVENGKMYEDISDLLTKTEKALIKVQES